jgi:hypothetical protein
MLNSKSIVGSSIIAALAIAVGLSGCTSTPAPTTSTISKAPAKTQTEILQAKIDARPKQGTAEYEQLFNKVEIPYIPGQPHEEVVAKYVDTINQYNTLGFSEAPHTSNDQTQWALEHNTQSRQATLDSIVAGLNLDYYDPGAMLAIFGADGQNTEYAREVIRNLRIQKNENLAYALSGQVRPDAPVTKLSENIIKEDANNIVATFTGYNYPGTAEKPNVQASCHLQVFTDSHGKATWVLVGDANSTF